MARTILVVDDERTLRETLAESLETEGFAVVQAADGREAVNAFRRSHPDLILLDLMLPELSGTEVCRIIRSESGVPILMLTAKSAELDKVVGLELGADDYVTKPFSFRELLARIRALLRRSEQQSQTAETDTLELGAVLDTVLHLDGELDAEADEDRQTGDGDQRQLGAGEAEGVRARRVLRPPSRPGLHAGSAAGARLGLRLRRRDPHGGRPRPLAQGAHRGRSRGPRIPGDCSRRGVRPAAARRRLRQTQSSGL